MSWRLAKSLETLRNQVNAAYPNRSKVSDGTGIVHQLLRWYSGDMDKITWEKVKAIGWHVTKNGCHEYKGYRNENGYGQFRPAKKSRLFRVHRIAYHNEVENLTAKDVILHLCDNPPCLNVHHLKKGTQTENIKDMWSKNRAHKSDLKECINGHIYPADRPRAVNKNRCRQCANERNKRYYLKKKLSNVLA